MTPAFERLKKQRGFTLLEVMVAVALLGIAMVAIHRAQAQGIRGMARSKNLTLGTMLAWQKMNDILINLRQDFPMTHEERKGDFDKPYDQFHWVLIVEENLNVPDMLRDKLPLLHLSVLWDTEATGGTKKRSGGGEPGAGKKVEIWMCVAKLQ